MGTGLTRPTPNPGYAYEMEHMSDPDPLGTYIRQLVFTAVEASRLGMAPDSELTTQIAVANILNAVRNPAYNPAPNIKGRHKP